MEQDFAGVGKEGVIGFPLTTQLRSGTVGTVVRAKILLENGGEHHHPVAGEGAAILVGIPGEPGEIAQRLRGDVSGPDVEGVKILLDVQVFRTAQAGGAKELEDGEVNVFELIGREGEEFGKRLWLGRSDFEFSGDRWCVGVNDTD